MLQWYKIICGWDSCKKWNIFQYRKYVVFKMSQIYQHLIIWRVYISCSLGSTVQQEGICIQRQKAVTHNEGECNQMSAHNITLRQHSLNKYKDLSLFNSATVLHKYTRIHAFTILKLKKSDRENEYFVTIRLCLRQDPMQNIAQHIY